jgi:nucleotide-binding universal stress UspA family protein
VRLIVRVRRRDQRQKDEHMLKRILVGTDGSDNATVAMRWAIDEAHLHAAEVEIVLAWGFLDQHHPDRRDRFDLGYDEDAAKATLASWVTQAIGDGSSGHAARRQRPTYASTARSR